MGVAKDIHSEVFGRLTALYPKRTAQGLYGWYCQCSCGNTIVVRTADLLDGHTQSCGCFQREKCSTHGLSNTEPYGIWVSILRRCNNRNSKYYFRYGGRGIKVCDEWLSYPSFYEWAISNGYEKGLSIDRIDNNGNYSPQNCRFTTMKEQQRNKRNTLFVNGIPLSEYAEKHSINYQTAYSRFKRGALT